MWKPLSVCTCGLRVFAILAILPRFGTMDCIVWIYVASWIVTGLAFLWMFLHKSRRLSDGEGSAVSD